MRLAKQGYGDIATIKNLDVGTFINLIHYEKFLDKYEYALKELNKKD